MGHCMALVQRESQPRPGKQPAVGHGGISPVTHDHCAGKCLPLRRFDIWEVAGTSPLPRRQGALSLFFRLYDPPDGKAFKC